MNLTGKTVLVTGASGFIGGHLAARLASEQGVRTRVLVRLTSRVDHLRAATVGRTESESAGIGFFYGDIADPSVLPPALEGVDVVFHCAALVRQWGQPEAFWRTNTQGTANLLAAAVKAGVRRFVHTSSTGVYGPEPADGTDESYPSRRCGDPYCDSKIEAEELALACCREQGLPVTILRPGDVYGPRSYTGTLGPLLAIKMGWLELIDGGMGLCNHLYVGNLVDAYLQAAQDERAIGQAYIITDGVGTPWRDFFGYYAAMVGKGPLPSVAKPVALQRAVEAEARAAQTGKPPFLTRLAVAQLTQQAVFRIDKARKELGYLPRVPLAEGMRLTEAWLREKRYI